MTPPAVDNLSLLMPEPTPAAAAPSRTTQGAGDSFQDHLARVNNGPNTERAPPRDERPNRHDASSDEPRRSEPTAADAEQRRRGDDTTRGAEASAAKDRPSKPEARADASDAEATKTTGAAGDGSQQGTENEHDAERDQSAAAVLAALAAAAQQPQPATKDEILLTAEAEVPEADASTTIGSVQTMNPELPDQPVPTPILQVEAETKSLELTNDDAARPDVTATDKVAVKAELKEIATSEGTTPAAAAVATEAVRRDAPRESRLDERSSQVADRGAVESTATVAIDSPAVDGDVPKSDKHEKRQATETKSAAAEQAATVTLAASPVSEAATSQVEAAQTAATTAPEHGTKKNDSGETGKSSHDVTSRTTPQLPETPRTGGAWSSLVRGGTTTETGPTGDLSQADRARLVQRLARAVQSAADRGGELQIRLSPPELGSLRLQVKLADGALSARLEAETPHARQILTDSLPQLRERLAQQDIRIERFDVELFSSGSGGGPMNLPDRRGESSHDSPQGGAGGSGLRRGSPAQAGEATVDVRRSVGNGRLDIVA